MFSLRLILATELPWINLIKIFKNYSPNLNKILTIFQICLTMKIKIF